MYIRACSIHIYIYAYICVYIYHIYPLHLYAVAKHQTRCGVIVYTKLAIRQHWICCIDAEPNPEPNAIRNKHVERARGRVFAEGVVNRPE